MQKIYTIQLDSLDPGQLFDDLELRAKSWERTAEYSRSGYARATSWLRSVGGAPDGFPADLELQTH
jgi:hypothetical protein